MGILWVEGVDLAHSSPHVEENDSITGRLGRRGLGLLRPEKETWSEAYSESGLGEVEQEGPAGGFVYGLQELFHGVNFT